MATVMCHARRVGHVGCTRAQGHLKHFPLPILVMTGAQKIMNHPV